jgi:hypothetical protein
MRASLARPRQHPAHPAPPLLDAGGARVVLGSELEPGGLARPIVPAADTLFGPRGACLAGPGGPLLVCDTGHHRLLVWRRAPLADRQPADLVVGQPDFHSEGRNARGALGPCTLNVPTGVACEGGVLAVADAWNHRVLVWRGGPDRSNQPPDVVLGQEDRTQGLANRGADRPRADTLNWCYGVALSGGRLFIADTGNRRVLVFDRLPERDGAPADLVLGEPDFGTRDENAGGAPGPVGMRWPHAVAVAGDVLLVADAGDNRVMGWRGLPRRDGAPCDLVLGQRDFASVDHNRAAYLPTAVGLNMPYGVTTLGAEVVVADTANSRLLGFPAAALESGGPARRLAAQLTFEDKGDNRWGPPRRDSLCWPYGVSGTGAGAGVAGGTLVVADSGNSRVLLWEAAR